MEAYCLLFEYRARPNTVLPEALLSYLLTSGVLHETFEAP
jgi:hypothetical protein